MITNIKQTSIYIILIIVMLFSVVAVQAQVKLAPVLEEMINETVATDSVVKVVILIEDDERQTAMKQIIHSRKMSRAERHNEVTNRLRFVQSQAAQTVESFLDQNAVSGYVKHWIVPAYTVELPISAIKAIANLEGVALIAPDASITYDPPVTSSLAAGAVTGISNHLEMLKVPQVWAKGLTGKGRLVCNFDTGVEQAHPALNPKWIGHETGIRSGWFSTIKPDSLPYDEVGHGTHTMGIMVGSMDADSFGVAPDAKWLAAGVVDQGKSLNATFSDILDAFEWVLNPDNDWNTTSDVPDVILNSWGVPKGMFSPCDDLFWTVIDNVEAAGVVTIFAAGNEGPDPMTIRNPADRASTPFNTFSVGAVDNNYVAADFSARGPSSCDQNQIKPEVMAPGVGIRSSTKNGGFISMSGTSMAAPYIAGLVALARQYNPDATPEQIKRAMIESVIDLGVAGEDNTYGYGFVNAEKMIELLPVPIVDNYSITKIMYQDESKHVPGGWVEFHLELTNPAGVLKNILGTIVDPDLDGLHIEVGRVPFEQLVDITTAVNIIPFYISIDSTFPNGFDLEVTILIESARGTIIDSVKLDISIGLGSQGEIATFDNGTLSLSVSDYGQLGFAQGSIYNAGGSGFRYDNSKNLLYEAGIIIGQRGYNISSALRNSDGSYRSSDFAPINSLRTEEITSDGGNRVTGSFSDQTSTFALPLEIDFEAIDYSENANDDMIFLTYDLSNVGLVTLDSVYFGFAVDFDLLGSSESVFFDDSLHMVYQVSPEGPLVGLVFLENLVSVTTVRNSLEKSGLSEAEYFNTIASTNIRLDHQASDDLYYLVGSGALKIAPEQSVEIKMALIAGSNLDDLERTAQLALSRNNSTNGSNPDTVPESFELYQNYPNPFNPSTTIAFSLTTANKIKVEILNVLGQSVNKFDLGMLPSGRHEVVWNGNSVSGGKVASGIYFYRVSGGGTTQTRKMLLLQ